MRIWIQISSESRSSLVRPYDLESRELDIFVWFEIVSPDSQLVRYLVSGRGLLPLLDYRIERCSADHVHRDTERVGLFNYGIEFARTFSFSTRIQVPRTRPGS